MRLFNYLEGIEFYTNGKLSLDKEIMGVTSRSSSIKEGYIFVCIDGLHTDGHIFACEAKRRGAALLVVERITDCVIKSGLPFIKTDNTRKALSLMCAKHVGNPERELKLIAVTGTNGKTSTCSILTEIYRKAGINACSLGTLDGGLTTPDPEELFLLLRRMFDSGITTVVMEASSHALAFDKLYGVDFKGGIFTNLTPEHLDFHKDMDEYAKCKSKLFSNCAYGLYNADDGYVETVKRNNKGRAYTYSVGGNADFIASNVRYLGVDGFEYDLLTAKDTIKIKSRLSGGFNVYNTLAAASAAYIDGISTEDIEKGISSIDGVKGRLERLDVEGSDISVYIDYAHTPDALEKVLMCIRSFKSRDQKLTLVFGCGGDRDRSKRKVMGRIASSLADLVVVTADNSRSENTSDIINEILKGIDKERAYKVIEDRETAIAYAIEQCEKNGIVLLCGKGHENYEIGRFGKRYFSEREIAVKAVNKRVQKE